MTLLRYVPLNRELIINFLIDKFKEINIVTVREEWSHIKNYEIEPGNMEIKFYHKDLGYLDVKEQNHNLFFTIPLLDIFRNVSKTDNLNLVKKLFSAMEENKISPNATHYEDTEYNLTSACRFGQLEVVKYLVSKGVNISVESEINIIVALKHKYYDLAKFLLDTDKKINQEIVVKNSNQEMISFIDNYNLYTELTQSNELVENNNKKIKI